MKRDLWNKCDECGKIIAYDDFGNGAKREMVLPDSDWSTETFETTCKKCNAAPTTEGK